MEVVKLVGMNRELAPPADWDAEKHGDCTPLPVFAEVVSGQVVLTSAWKPNAQELEELNKGGAVACVVFGAVHPPVAIGVFPAEVSEGHTPLTGEGGVHPDRTECGHSKYDPCHNCEPVQDGVRPDEAPAD